MSAVVENARASNQAETVMLPVSWRSAKSPTSTYCSVEPLKLSAGCPFRPLTQVGPATKVPVLPCPDESWAVLPDPSFSFQSATSPGGGGGLPRTTNSLLQSKFNASKSWTPEKTTQ